MVVRDSWVGVRGQLGLCVSVRFCELGVYQELKVAWEQLGVVRRQLGVCRFCESGVKWW